MRRTLLISLALSLVLVAPARAGTAVTELQFCEGGDYCRYFLNAHLGVYFVDSADEANELTLTRSGADYRIRDAVPIALRGDFCDALGPHEVSCGPRPIPGSVYGIDETTLTALAGGGADRAFVDAGSADMGPGNDSARGHGLIEGGPGDDDIRAIGGKAILLGGAGEDVLIGAREGDDLRGAAGPDVLAGGRGRDELSAGAGDDLVRATDGDRDVVRCGPGRDRAFVSRRDRVADDCERVRRGEPG